MPNKRTYTFHDPATTPPVKKSEPFPANLAGAVRSGRFSADTYFERLELQRSAKLVRQWKQHVFKHDAPVTGCYWCLTVGAANAL